MTLIETMLALVVLVTGIAAVFGMANHVQTANNNLKFQTLTLDYFARISAQIRNARCDFPASLPTVAPGDLITDPGLNPGLAGVAPAFGGWVVAPTGSITLVGVTDGAALPLTVPRLQIAYRMSLDTTTVPNIPSYDIEVQIREITNDPARDNINLVDGHWIRVYPISKVCNARLDEQARGEYP